MMSRTQCEANHGMVVLDPDSPTGLSCDTGQATKEPVDPNSISNIHQIVSSLSSNLKAKK